MQARRSFVRRARIWADGFFLPKTSTRFQYDFRTRSIWDLWVSYHPTEHLEVRMGRSWLPFVGDYTESPFFLDMIDFPAAWVLFPAREHGVFFVGDVGETAYSINIVQGSGWQSDSNRWKDVFGHVKSPFFNDRLTLGFAHYEGSRRRIRTASGLKRRVTGDFIWKVHSLLTVKGSWLAGRDGEVSSQRLVGPRPASPLQQGRCRGGDERFFPGDGGSPLSDLGRELLLSRGG